MPRTGGRSKNVWTPMAVAMVTANRAMARRAPTFMVTTRSLAAGPPGGTAKCMIAAGMTAFIKAGRNNVRKAWNGTTPFCQTIRVVMSPNGLKAPPALAATTILMQDNATNLGAAVPAAMDTADITSAVVRLSANGEITNDKPPVSQNSLR